MINYTRTAAFELARHGIRTSTDDSAYCLLGHRWPEGITLPVGARLLTERQLVHYLDRREGRSLTFSTDEDLIQNLRKIQTTAAQPLLPWLHFLQTSGVPDLVLAELLAQSLRKTASERTAILATIQPYLPWAVQLTLTEVLSAKHGSREVFPKVPGGSLRERLMRVVRDGIK